MRLRGVSSFHRPCSVDEALSLLEGYRGSAALLAGGVDLARSPRRDVKALVDVMGLDLRGMQVRATGLHIGAAATLSEIREWPESSTYAGGVIRRALDRFSAVPVRNMATLGGAVASAHGWSDIPTILAALDAEVLWYDGTPHRAPLDGFYRMPFRRILNSSLLTEIVLPPCEGIFEFQKLTRSAADIAILNAACGVALKEGRVVWARIAVGATPYRAERLRAVEEGIRGEVASQTLWDYARSETHHEVRVADDNRATARWRRRAAGVIVGRALARAAERVQSGEEV